jgi:surface-anchored protein
MNWSGASDDRRAGGCGAGRADADRGRARRHGAAIRRRPMEYSNPGRHSESGHLAESVRCRAAGGGHRQSHHSRRQGYSFLGKPGDPVWLLPQVQKPGILWPGWNTQEPEVATTVNREVTWKLTGVQGPGRFALFLNGEFGAPQLIFDSTKPFPQETGIEVNTHVHGNWAFSAPGPYALAVVMTGTTKAGKPLAADGTLRIQVGNEPVGSAPPPVTPMAAADPPLSATWWWVGGVVVVILGLVWWRRRGSSS